MRRDSRMRFDRLKERIAVFTLQRDDARELVNRTRSFEVLERLHRTDKERAVANGNHDIGGNTAESSKVS